MRPSKRKHQNSDDVNTSVPCRRSGRVPKDGVAKLAQIERAIRPDLYPDPKQPGTKGIITGPPESMPVNPMAPARKARATRSKKAQNEFGSAAPGPASLQPTPEFTPQEPGSRYGFSKPGVPAPALEIASQPESTPPPLPYRTSGPVQYHSSSYSQLAPSQGATTSSQPPILGMQPTPRGHSPLVAQPIQHAQASVQRQGLPSAQPHPGTYSGPDQLPATGSTNPSEAIQVNAPPPVYDPYFNVSETESLPPPNLSHRMRNMASDASSDESSSTDEMQGVDLGGPDSTGSMSGHSEDEERGNFESQNIDPLNFDSSDGEAGGPTAGHDDSRPPLRPQSPALEAGFDVSPDEDERRAQAALSGAPKGKGRGRRVAGAAMATPGASDGHSYNILENHHRKNGVPRAPDPEVLRTIHAGSQHASERLPSVSTPVSRLERLNNKGSVRSPEDDRAQSQHSPTQLQFYPPIWRDILESAKGRFRLYISTVKPFPGRDEGIVESANCISEALSEHKRQGKKIEPNYQRKHKGDMAILIYEDASSFRGDLKRLARQIVHSHYDIFIHNSIGHNSSDALKYTSGRVKFYLHFAQFLKDDVLDDQGRTKNIQHKAISALVRIFYYQKKKMGQRFPVEFGESVPNVAISLACCAIKCCLMEWLSGTLRNVQFAGETFGKDINKMLETIAEVEANDYHGPLFRNVKKEWAKSGTTYTSDPDNTQAIHNDFQVTLD